MANLIMWNSMNSPNTYRKAGRPAGPHILAQWLIQFGFTVKVIDFCSGMTTKNLVDITRKHIDATTVAIGVSTTFWENTSMRTKVKSEKMPATNFQTHNVESPEWVAMARTELESAFPKLDWILGGANSETPLIETWLRFHQNPEDQIRKYLDEKLSLNRIYTPFNILSNTGTYMDNLGIRPEEVLGFEWGRGCQFKCRFCRYKLIGKEKNTYLRNPDIIRQDLILNYEKYGTTRYIYVDDTTNESIEKVDSMVRIAQSLPFQIEWIGYGRLDLIGSNKSMIDSLRDSGLRSMFFGIESFNQEASKIVGKGWNGVHGKEFLLELKQRWGNDINFHNGFIVGLNPETVNELNETLEWCIQNKIASWHFNPLAVANIPLLDSSEFDQRCTEFGYSFPDPNRPNYWVNGEWDATKATIVANELNNKSWKVATLASFPLADVSSITGESFTKTMTRRFVEDPATTNELLVRSEEIIQDYVNYQLS